MSEPSIGIDFGTTTSSMAWVDPDTGKARILKNAEGEEKTPSVVYVGAGAGAEGKAVPRAVDMRGKPAAFVQERQRQTAEVLELPVAIGCATAARARSC